MKCKKTTRLYEWQVKCKSGNEKCRKCGETKFLTVEHIVPVHLLEQFLVRDRNFLSYELDMNYEILCKWCNQEKRGNLDVRNPKTFEVLEYIINESKKEVGV